MYGIAAQAGFLCDITACRAYVPGAFLPVWHRCVKTMFADKAFLPVRQCCLQGISACTQSMPGTEATDTLPRARSPSPLHGVRAPRLDAVPRARTSYSGHGLCAPGTDSVH